MRLGWGYYSNFDENIHEFSTEIRVYYKLLMQQWNAVSVGWLIIHAYTNEGLLISHLVEKIPEINVPYTGYILINAENYPDAFNSIKNGDFIKSIEVTLIHERYFWGSQVNVYVDYVDILYYVEQYTCDFNYKLDFSSYGLTTVDAFDVNVDLYDTTPGVGIYLRNFVTDQWDKYVETTDWYDEFHEFTVGSNPDYYFNDDEELWIRFFRSEFNDAGHFPSDMLISVDWIEINFQVPDAPSNILVDQEIGFVYLSWDIPDDHGLPILNYNIYRGTSSGGSKPLINSTTVNYLNDTSGIIGVPYYYIFTTNTSAGESANSTEVMGKARDAPFVQWNTPEANETVIFGVGDAIFHLTYDFTGLDDIILEINGISYGTVMDKNSTILNPYDFNIDGPVNCTLYGYISTEVDPIVNDSREFTFTKYITDVNELLERDRKFIGQKLYLILHDPNGDNSYSSYEESATVSMAVGAQITSGISTALTLGEILSVDAVLFSFESGYTNTMEMSMKTEIGFDFRYDITDTTALTSSQDSTDNDYIGPGYGDRYWGEAWTLQWELKARHRVYFNGTDRYEAPKFHYGLIRGGEVFLDDYNAPINWKMQNPVHNDSQDVLWLDNLTVAGGAPYTNTHEVTSTLASRISLEIGLKDESYTKITGFSHTLTVELSTKIYAETSLTNSYKVGYSIYDDESTDTIVQQYGIDQRFGTFIFKTNEFMCETSYPLEHDTFDYIPPIIQFPEIELDSSHDGISPCVDDSPVVTVDIFDEGGIQSALIYFSINNGTTWNSAILYEQAANPGTWQGFIPSYPRGTEVLWYIKVWDYEGQYSNRTDPHGKPYKYRVLNRAPSVTIITPNGGELYQEMISIHWTASDPDNDDLTYSIAYNIENMGWHLIVGGLSDTSYQWNASNFDSQNVLLKIIAYDGDMLTEDETDFVFTIHSPPHVPSLNAPDDFQYALGSTGNEIEWVVFDEDLAEYSIYRDGIFLYSSEFNEFRTNINDRTIITVNVDDHGLGTYIYRIEITDYSGYSVFDEVVVGVYNNPEITSEIQGNIIIWTITDTYCDICEYSISRNTQEIDSGNWIPDVPIETVYSGINPGDYVFTIYATDGLGGKAAHVVLITILDPPEPPVIPGYNLIVLLGVFSLVVTMAIRRKSKNN